MAAVAVAAVGVPADAAAAEVAAAAAGVGDTAAGAELRGTTCPGGALAATYVTVSAQMTYNTTLNYPALPSSYNFTAQSTARLK